MAKPSTVQPPRIAQLNQSRLNRRAKQLATPARQVNQTQGTRNVRGKSGMVWRRISTPPYTAENAIRVPIEVRLASRSSGNTAASSAIMPPVNNVLTWGVRGRGCTLAYIFDSMQ